MPEYHLLPDAAAVSATAYDYLWWYEVGIAAIMTALIFAGVFFFAMRYRRRSEADAPAEIEGSRVLEIAWSVIPFLVMLTFFFWGAALYFRSQNPPPDAMNVYVVAKQWMWKVQYPNGVREINELHVPLGRAVKLTMASEDVIHSFFIPGFRVHMDVLPNRYTSVWFQATKPGEFHLFCSQYCGTNHAGMIGTVVVLEQADFENWLSLHAEGSLALEGRKVFLKYRCVSCHSANAGARAPVLEGLYGNAVRLNNGRSLIADDAYIRESILDPGAKIAAGWENIMPTFRGQITEEEIYALIAYFRQLQRGQTPRRVEDYPPPTGTPPIRTTAPETGSSEGKASAPAQP